MSAELNGLGTLVGGMEVEMKEPNLIGEESNLISFVISYCLFFLKSNWIGLWKVKDVFPLNEVEDCPVITCNYLAFF